MKGNPEVGKTYKNKGAGRTVRTVVAIEKYNPTNPPIWFSSGPRPDDMVVVYTAGNAKDHRRMYMKSFKAWVGEEV